MRKGTQATHMSYRSKVSLQLLVLWTTTNKAMYICIYIHVFKPKPTERRTKRIRPKGKKTKTPHPPRLTPPSWHQAQLLFIESLRHRLLAMRKSQRHHHILLPRLSPRRHRHHPQPDLRLQWAVPRLPRPLLRSIRHDPLRFAAEKTNRSLTPALEKKMDRSLTKLRRRR